MAAQKQTPAPENTLKGQQQKAPTQEAAGPRTATLPPAGSPSSSSPLLQPAYLLGLQRAVGNRAVQRLLASRPLQPASHAAPANTPTEYMPTFTTPIQLKRNRDAAFNDFNYWRVPLPGQFPLELHNSPEQWAFIDKFPSESEGEKKLDYLLVNARTALRDLDSALAVQKYLDDGGSLQKALAALEATENLNLKALKLELRNAFTATMEAAEVQADKAAGNPLELGRPKNAEAIIYSSTMPKEKSAGTIKRGQFFDILGQHNDAIGKAFYKIRLSDGPQTLYYILQDATDRALHRYVATDVGGLALWGPEGPKPADVEQGMIGNCYLLAPLQAIAGKQPEFIKSIFENETATKVTVNFYNKAQKVPIRVDKKVMAFASELTIPASEVTQGLWPAMIEKAFAIFKAQLSSKKPQSSYGAIEGGQSADTLAIITGNPKADLEETVLPTQEKDKSKLLTLKALTKVVATSKLLNNKNNIVLVSSDHRKLTEGALRTAGVPEPQIRDFYTSKEGTPITLGHAYTVHDSKNQEVSLNNPHGAGKYIQTLNKYQYHMIFDWPRFAQLKEPPQQPKASTTTYTDKMVQRRPVKLPKGGTIETEDLTEKQLDKLVSDLAKAPAGTLEAMTQIFAAQEAGEFKYDFNSLYQMINDFLEEDLFDKKTYLPLDAALQMKHKKTVLGMRRELEGMEKHYDPKQKQKIIPYAEALKRQLIALDQEYTLQYPSPVWEEYIDKLSEEGLFSDPEFVLACRAVIAKPADPSGHELMKKLVGEMLGRSMLKSKLKRTKGKRHYIALHGVFILEVRALDASFKPGDRAGLIHGLQRAYGWVIGELDSLFVIPDPHTHKYIPAIILESKGGALSSAAVAQQKAKEKDRLLKVAKDPKGHALAKRDPKGSFTIITDDFAFEGFDIEALEVLSSGPIRTGAQQYDLSLGLTTPQLEILNRYIAFNHYDYKGLLKK